MPLHRENSVNDSHRTDVVNGMCIDWDIPITMDDGLVLRADVFRPVGEESHPVRGCGKQERSSRALQKGGERRS